MFTATCKICDTSFAGDWRTTSCWIINHFECAEVQRKCIFYVMANCEKYFCNQNDKHTGPHSTKTGAGYIINWGQS